MTAKGSVSADISNFTVKCTVGLTTQTLPDGKVVPAFSTPYIYFDLPKKHISIHIHGNVIANIAESFKKLFMGTIRDEITSSLNSVIKKELPPALDKLVAKQKGQTELYRGINLDWAIP